jgi:hypothetical protein
MGLLEAIPFAHMVIGVQMRKCWICGNPATTGEHKIKRSDLQRVHGTGKDFRTANLSYLKSDSLIVPLQGPNSKHVKYQKNLCSPCNNAKSQPFDRAYDEFVEYVEANTDQLLMRRQIDFSAIYSTNWRESQINLFNYFVKSFGCRIYDAGKSVPTDLVNLFKDQYPDKSFAVCFAVDEAEIIKPRNLQTKLGIGNIVFADGADAEIRFAAAGRYRWLLISYWYNWGPYGPMGEPWHREQQFVCLGSYTEAESKTIIRRQNGTFVNWSGIEA